MKRLLLFVFATFASISSAQADVLQATPYQGTIGNLGTYHVRSGKWTKPSDVQAFASPQVVYDKTVGNGFFWNLSAFGSPQRESVDEGIGINPFVSQGYEPRIRDVFIGVFNNSGANRDIELRFYDGIDVTGDTQQPQVGPTIQLLGIPNGGWFIGINLGTGFKFSDLAGAGFEFGLRDISATPGGIGPLLVGANPVAFASDLGTAGPVGDTFNIFHAWGPNQATGGATHSGPFWFGGTPFASFALGMVAVPEPSSAILLLGAAMGLMGIRRRK